MIEARSDEEVQQIRDASRRIMLQLPGMPGFLSFQGTVVGRRLSTVTLWETRESARQVMREANHKQASSEMFGGAVGSAFHSSTWALERLGELWVRCANAEPSGTPRSRRGADVRQRPRKSAWRSGKAQCGSHFLDLDQYPKPSVCSAHE